MKDTVTLLDHWLMDKEGRKVQIEHLNNLVRDHKIDRTEEFEIANKLMAEDITVLRWFVEKLLYEARDNADRAKGNAPD